MTIYIDQFLLTNFLLDYFILHLTKTILKSGCKGIKLVVCSTFEAVCALVIFIPTENIFFQALSCIAVSAVTVSLCFSGFDFRVFVRAAAVFYSVAFTTGGICRALHSDNLIYILSFSVVICRILSAVTASVREMSEKYKNLKKEITVSLGGKTANLKAYCDTGNQLNDPFGNKPVTVASLSAVEKILPKTLSQSLKSEADTLEIYASIGEKYRLKLIPCKTIKGRCFLIGFTPESAVIDGREIKTTVAVSAENIGAANGCNAIFGPQLI